MSYPPCYVCGSIVGQNYRSTEFMLGLGGEYLYWECFDCGCVALQNPPQDWRPFYPSNYYSFGGSFRDGIATRIADYLRLHQLTHSLMSYVRPDPLIASLAPLRKTDTILDVGAGKGHTVIRLRSLGYRATGIDPFLEEETKDPDRPVRKCEFASVAGSYRLILLAHSLEHIADQRGTLRLVRERLAADGRAVIRIPLALADWREKRGEWWELDPPRHLFLHTPKSLAILAEEAGLRVTRTVFDSPNRSRNRQGQGERASFTLVPATAAN
jgi:SAM-dependent methyltransferase